MSSYSGSKQFKRGEKEFGEGTIIDVREEIYDALLEGSYNKSCSILNKCATFIKNGKISDADDLFEQMPTINSSSSAGDDDDENSIDGKLHKVFITSQWIPVDKLLVCKLFQRDRSNILKSFLMNKHVVGGIGKFDCDSYTPIDVIHLHNNFYVVDGYGRLTMALFHPEISELPCIIRDFDRYPKEDLKNKSWVLSKVRQIFTNINVKRTVLTQEQYFNMKSEDKTTEEYRYVHDFLPLLGLEYDISDVAKKKVDNAMKARLEGDMTQEIPKILTFDMLHNLIRCVHYQRDVMNKPDKDASFIEGLKNATRLMYWLIWQLDLCVIPEAEILTSFIGTEGYIRKSCDNPNDFFQTVQISGQKKKKNDSDIQQGIDRMFNKITTSFSKKRKKFSLNEIQRVIQIKDAKCQNIQMSDLIIRTLSQNVDLSKKESEGIMRWFGFDRYGKYTGNGMMAMVHKNRKELVNKIELLKQKEEVKIESLKNN